MKDENSTFIKMDVCTLGSSEGIIPGSILYILCDLVQWDTEVELNEEDFFFNSIY
jgi:hypothetical protein